MCLLSHQWWNKVVCLTYWIRIVLQHFFQYFSNNFLNTFSCLKMWNRNQHSLLGQCLVETDILLWPYLSSQLTLLTQFGIASNGLLAPRRCRWWPTAVTATSMTHIEIRNRKYKTATCTASTFSRVLCCLLILVMLKKSSTSLFNPYVEVSLFDSLRSILPPGSV